MKFKKALKDKAYIYAVNNRKVAAYQRKIREAQKAYPLIADEITLGFKPVDQVMSERVCASVAKEQKWRDNRAEEWIKARARLRASPFKAEVYQQWQNRRWITRDPVFLLDMVWRAENPGIHHTPAWAYPKPTAAQISLAF